MDVTGDDLTFFTKLPNSRHLRPPTKRTEVLTAEEGERAWREACAWLKKEKERITEVRTWFRDVSCPPLYSVQPSSQQSHMCLVVWAASVSIVAFL